MTEENQILKNQVEKFGLEESRIKAINRSIFDFTKEQMESGERKPVRIPKCGLFSCKDKRVEELEKRNLL